MHDDDGEHIASRFWNPGRIMLAGLFILGLVIGGYVTNQYVDPYLNGAQGKDINSLLTQNARLDSRNDMLYSCLVKNITPESCEGNGQPAVQQPAVARPDSNAG